jgi:CarboxypepD_reg-like domain
MKYVLLLLLLTCVYSAHTQKVLKGTVIEQETNKPIQAASVFLNNTSVGTTTNGQGYFELEIPNGKFDLIVSSIGFETFSQTITANDIITLSTIKLAPKVKALEAVVVEPFLKDGWEKWGRFFLESFIGTSAFAADCRIKNIQAIKFRHSKKDNTLTAIALEPLIIENKALGYTIRYQLENFTYQFNDRYVFYQGYPFFEPMKGNAARQKRWTQNRKAAYEGSLLHFMRSLYRNKLIEEGFSMNHLKKVPNTEKQRVKEIFKKATRTVQSENTTLKINSGASMHPDSSAYYSTVMRQPDRFDVLSKVQLSGDSVAFAIDSTTAGLLFEDHLLVVYKKKEAPVEYQKFFPDAGKAMLSQITLLNNLPITIEANGAYYHPADLMSLGYWAWSEKVVNLLPFDYVAPDSSKY